MKKLLKILLGIFIIILLCICLFLDVLYIFYLQKEDKKVIATTYEVGMQVDSSGNEKYFAEVNYFTNKNRNGYEMFEVKFNYFLDETKNEFYTQGMQYIAFEKDYKLTPGYSIEYSNYTFSENKNWLGRGTEAYSYMCNKEIQNSNCYNYAISNDKTIISTNTLFNNPGFKIQLGNELFLMKFKGQVRNSQNLLDEYDYYETSIFGSVTITRHFTYYAKIDVNYFSELLFNSVQTIAPGTCQSIIFEFGDLFTYHKYDAEKKTYEATSTDCSLLENNLKSYYAIKVNVSENGARKSTDSIFKCINKDENWSNGARWIGQDYFVGRTAIYCDNEDFILVESENLNEYYLDLSPKFKKDYYDYKENIVLIANVNRDLYTSSGKKIVDFTENCFDEFYTERTVIYN